MKKVCFLMASLQPGGAENYLLRFLKYSAGEFDATVICKSGMAGELEEDFRNLGVRILPLKMGYFNFSGWYKVFTLLKKESFDCICDFTGNFAGIYMFIGRLANTTKRVTFYRQSSDHFKPGLLNNVYNYCVKNLVYQFSTNILANSKAAFDYFFKNRWQGDKRFLVIYNGLDPNLFKSEKNRKEIREALNLPTDRFIVGHTGRYDVAKNHPTIIKVAKELIQRDHSFHFVFCGRNTDCKEIKDAINEQGLNSNINVLGYRRDVPTVLKCFDLFYFPSITEGQPNSLIEAMYAGLPIVASNIDPIKECTPDYIHGELLDPSDVSAAVERIIKIRSGAIKVEPIELREWATDFFSHDKRFKQFLEILK